MALFVPVFKFYSSYEDYYNDANVELTITAGTWFDQVYGFDFQVHRFGGCVEGSMTVSYNLSTFIRNGWYFRFWANSTIDPWYVGTVENISKRRAEKSAVLSTIGLVNKLNMTPDIPYEFGSVGLDSAIESMVTIARESLFGIGGETKTYKFTKAGVGEEDNFGIPLVPQLRWTWLPGDPLLEQLRLIEALTSKLCYGIAGDVGQVQADSPTISDTDFFAIWGEAPVRSWRIENDDFILSREDEKWSTIVNEVVLQWTNNEGDVEEYISRADGSIQAYGLRSRTVQLWPMTQQEALIWGSLFLSRYSVPSTTWELTITHEDVAGSDRNYIENSPPWPWYERIGMKDEMNSIVLDRAEVQSVSISMDQAGVLSFSVVAGEDRSDLEDFTQSIKIATGNVTIPSVPNGGNGNRPPVGGCPSKYHPSANYDLSTLEAPVAFPGPLLDDSLFPEPVGTDLYLIPNTSYTTDRGEVITISDSGLRGIPNRVTAKTQTWGWDDPDTWSYCKLVYPHWAPYYRDDPANAGFEYQVPAYEQEIKWLFYQPMFFQWIFNPMMAASEFDRNTKNHVNWIESLCSHRYKYGKGGFLAGHGNYDGVNVLRWSGWGWGYDITTGGIPDLDSVNVKDYLHAGLQFHLGLWIGGQPSPLASAYPNDLSYIYATYGTDSIFITRPTRKAYSIDTGAQALPAIAGITRAQVENSTYYLTDGGAAEATNRGSLLALTFEWTGSGANPVNESYSLLEGWPIYKKIGDRSYTLANANQTSRGGGTSGLLDTFRKGHYFEALGFENRADLVRNDYGSSFKRGSTESHMIKKLVEIPFDSITEITTMPQKQYFEYRVRGYDNTL